MMKLFCLPYAGGSEAIFNGWKPYLEPSIKVVPIQLKGRGRRYRESFYKDVNEAVNDIYESIKDELDNNEYGIYGHSMGSILAYELYFKIKSMRKKVPKHIFFSASQAPHIARINYISSNLSDEEFIDKLIKMGGIPKELIENKELAELFVPIIKNDIRLMENYNYIDREEKLLCSISVLSGDKDMYKKADVIEWENYTIKEFESCVMSGGHFFINENVENITGLIKNTLLKSI